MAHNVTFHCSHCSTPIPADDQEFGFFRDDDNQIVCIHCFNIVCDEDLLECSLEECFESIMGYVKAGDMSFDSALTHIRLAYGLSGDGEDALRAMYKAL